MPTTPRLEQALAYAARLHAQQHRKGGRVPYITHLMAVAAIVGEHGGDEDMIIAALLHDGPEDQGGQATLDDIRTRFGDRVADLIDGCTDTYETPKPEWRPRKQAYIDRLPTLCAEARLISAADKLHNLRCIVADHRRHGDEAWRIFKTGRDGVIWYYQQVIAQFQQHGPHDLAAELQATLAQLH
jgi:(p)ppGpp synthase/HD superfamily hydrolase